MVEGDAFATNERFSRGYGMSDRDHVVKLFTRKNCAVPLEEEAPTKAPKITSLSQCQLEPSYRASAHGFRSGSRMAVMPDDGDSSRECLYTPAEAASSSILPITSPELKLKEFEQELAKLKASRLKQRTALREQVLSGTDIYAGPSSSALVPKIPAAAVSEHDAPFSVSSRSSEENLTFVDATDELNEDEQIEDKKTTNTDSVDFSFLHSVYRGKGKHEEAILLRMKYAGNKAARARFGDTGALDSASSKSIIGASAADTDAKMVQEFLRGTLLNWDSRPPALEKAPSPGTGSMSASGSTTPRQRCRDGSRDSSVPTSNRTSRTSVETGPSTIASLRPASLPPTQSKSSLVSSPSGSCSSSLPLRPHDVSRTPSSPSQISETESPVLFHQTDLHKYPVCDSPESSTYHEYPPSEVSRRSTFNEYPTSESPRHSGYNENPASELPRLGYDENPTSESPRHSTYEYPTSLPAAHITSKSHQSSTSLDEGILPAYDTMYPISECSTEDDWPFRSERSDRSSTKTLDIPITIDGRVVFPEVIFAEDVRTTRSLGPLGLLDKVKSFAQSCGPGTQDNEQSLLQAFTEGLPEGEKPCAKFNAALLSRLTCVICGALCTPPVAMCAWGHVVCEECRPVSLWESQGRCTCRKRCPQCSGNMMSKPCELWSNIARSLLYPCRYTTNGCGESQGLTPAKKQLHEQACVWRQLRCWCPGCSWRGFWHQFRAHVDRVHLPGATRADWYRFVAVSGATRIGRSSDAIVLPANELVLLHSLYVIGEHRYLLQYLNDDRGGGAVAIVPRFKLRVTSKDGRSEVEVRGEAVPGQHDVERALRSGKCFRLSGTPFGTNPPGERFPPEESAVQLCLEKGRLSVS